MKSPVASCALLPLLRNGQVDAVAGAENLRLGNRNGARTNAGCSITASIVGVDEGHVYGDFQDPARNVVTHEIEAVRTQANFIILLPPFNNNSLIFPFHNGCRRGRHHGHRRDTTRSSTIPTPRSKPTIKSSTQSFSLISPPLNILTTF